MQPSRRNSLRLEGFDYSQPGEYFVTICTAGRRCILGDVADGKMQLSEAGKIVERCWREIPNHFPNTRVDVFQVMPNHVHGIIEITPHTTGRGGVSPPHSTNEGGETPPLQWPRLGDIIAFFKYQATKQLNASRGTPGQRVFQRGFYDRIIRDDREHFYIEQYTALNPLTWHLDRHNPGARKSTADQLRQELREKHGLDEYAIEHIVDGWMNG